jgi:hypothetical protein
MISTATSHDQPPKASWSFPDFTPGAAFFLQTTQMTIKGISYLSGYSQVRILIERSRENSDVVQPAIEINSGSRLCYKITSSDN